MRRAFAVGALFLCYLFVIAGAGTAGAVVPPELAKFPAEPSLGQEAGQLDSANRMAVDNSSGHVYVAEAQGKRVSEFTAWGQYVKTWGWGVANGAPELQVCGTVANPHCQRGLEGSGPGQMGIVSGVSVSTTGDIYLLEAENHRVQKFNSAGEFLLMFGKEVNKTTNGNICPVAPGDICGAGVAGSGGGEFSNQANSIAVGAGETVYVGDTNRIEEFEASGVFKKDIPLPKAGVPGGLSYSPASKSLWMFFATIGAVAGPPVFELDPETGEVMREVKTGLGAPVPGLIGALANDDTGNLFVSFDLSGSGKPELEWRILEYDKEGGEVIGFDDAFASPPPALNAEADITFLSLATNHVEDLYVLEASDHLSRVTAYGPPPTFYGPPPPNPPRIEDQYAVSVGADSATLKTKINPRFWADATYYLEYGTAPCFEGGCAKSPPPPGRILTDQVIDVGVTSEGMSLSGLTPDTTYHYRFVAQSGGGGGSVFGLSGKSGAEAESTFTTLPVAPPQPVCPANEAFRSGAGLPDCRAYEMVSPVEKNGADIEVVFNSNGFPTAADQAAGDGESITYSAYRAFGEVESSPYASQYIATRGARGWTSRGISPPREGASFYNTKQLDSQYKGFTADLCQGWLLQDTDNSLAEEGWVEGSPTFYHRDLCPANGPYTAIAPRRLPTGGAIADFLPELQGFSADGSVALIQANGKLSNNGSTERQLYETVSGGLRLVCILPAGTPLKGPCSAGAGGSTELPARLGNLQHAISEDGTRIYWSDSKTGEGKLYLRIDHAETKVVSESPNAHFWGAAADGSAAVYSADSELRRYSLATETSVKVAGGFQGILAISEDAGRVYFASSEAIAGSGANPQGEEASAGVPNLYLYETGEPARVAFVARLSAADTAKNEFPSDTSSWPIFHLARTTADGGALAFTSTRSLTGFDNTETGSGNPATEVYIYRAGSAPGAEALTCVSCMPTGVRPQARIVEAGFLAAAYLPVAESQLYTPRVLAEDGDRLFFESFDPLVPADTNREQDVYEWEAVGAGNCTGASPGYNTAFEGCVNLISSGDSPMPSEIVDSSPDGRDVFFKTESGLLPQDPGQVDIYDAREGGGFPPPAPPPPSCQGEGCQPAGQAPADAVPSSETYEGPANEPSSKPAHKCPKGKHKVKRHGKPVCVKNNPKQGKKHSTRKGARR